MRRRQHFNDLMCGSEFLLAELLDLDRDSSREHLQSLKRTVRNLACIPDNLTVQTIYRCFKTFKAMNEDCIGNEVFKHSAVRIPNAYGPLHTKPCLSFPPSPNPETGKLCL